MVAVPSEIEPGFTTFRFGSEHERKMSSIRGSMHHMEGVYAGSGMLTRSDRSESAQDMAGSM